MKKDGLSKWLNAGAFALLWGSELSMAQTGSTNRARTFKVQTTDGMTIAVYGWGNPNGPEIVFIHGFSQSHLSWRRQFESDLEKSFRMIVYDLGGPGRSDKPLDGVYYRDHRGWADELKAVKEFSSCCRR